jgi:hypothetical protein
MPLLNVMWAGKPSMRWLSIVPVVKIMINCFGLLKSVIIHCVSTGSLLFSFKMFIMYLQNLKMFLLSKNLT